MTKRQVEVFTAGCPVCEPAVQLVKQTACPDCEVIVYDLNVEGIERAGRYNLRSLPAVAVNGSLLSCCDNRGIKVDDLKAAGVGRSLGGA